MAEINWPDPKEPTARAVRLGRAVFCVVGAVLLCIGGWFSYHNPHDQLFLASLVLGAGIAFVWLGLALPPKIVAHCGFELPWFIG